MTDVRDDFVERMGGALTEAGLPRLPSRIFSALLIDDDGRMTSAELVESLSVSAAGISGAVKYLVQIGMIRRERERGSRRDVFVVDDDAWYETMMRQDSRYAPMLAALRHATRAVGKRSPAHRRLVLTREFLQFIDDEMSGLAPKWERRRKQIEKDL